MKFLKLMFILFLTNCIKEINNSKVKFKNLNEELIIAIEKRNIQKFKYLIKLGADVNYIFNNKTVIEYAIENEDLKIIIELLENENLKYDENIIDKIYNISLNNLNNYPIFLILKKGKIVEKNLIDENKLFLFLCFISNSKIVENFVKDNKLDPTNTEDKDKRNGLILATLGQKRDVMELLVRNYKININYKDKNGNSALILASAYGLEEELKLLIHLGADINDKGINESTALSNLIQNNLPELAKFLIINGADLEAKDAFGCTPLMFACEEGNIEIIDMLLNKGVDINSKCKEGNTALMYALRFKNQEIFKILLEKGANINEANFDGDTPLILACSNRNEEAAKLLIRKGADLSHKNNLGNTPLIIAVVNNLYDIIKILLENNVQINLANYKGNTPLIIAVANRNFQISKILLDNGANIEDKNDLNLSAFDYSRIDNNPTLYNLLKSAKNYRTFIKVLRFKSR